MARIKRWFVLALLPLLLSPALALALTGQSYDTFLKYYQEDVTFINDNAGRHLLSMVLSKRQSGENDGRVYYDLIGDALNVTVTVNAEGVIEECEIRLTRQTDLPSMEYGSVAYNDFAISGYHSYAFLMAMDTSADPAQRYPLVEDVVQGMKDGSGSYTRQLGVYTLQCSKPDDSTAVLNFQNDGMPQDTPTPAPSGAPAPDGTAPDGTAPDATAPDAPTETDPDASDFMG